MDNGFHEIAWMTCEVALKVYNIETCVMVFCHVATQFENAISNCCLDYSHFKRST